MLHTKFYLETKTMTKIVVGLNIMTKTVTRIADQLILVCMTKTYWTGKEYFDTMTVFIFNCHINFVCMSMTMLRSFRYSKTIHPFQSLRGFSGLIDCI